MLRKILHILSASAWVNWVLPYMMLVLIYGTIRQGWIGLYDATQAYFMAPFFWIGVVPLPGMSIICVLLSVNLLAKLILDSLDGKSTFPSILTHLSVLLLLSGGLLTGFMAREGYIDLLENGESKARIHDYHKRVLRIDGTQIDLNDLSQGQIIDGFAIEQICRNCLIDENAGTIVKQPVSKEDEENLAALRIRDITTDQVIYLSEKQGGTPLLYQNKALLVDREQRPLPFALKLHKFNAENHPGTDMAKSYSSIVTLTDGSQEITSRVSMNEPLRYKGYTIYQASYFETEGGMVSVLSVVENLGRRFPYIAGLLMALGLTLQAMRPILSRGKT